MLKELSEDLSSIKNTQSEMKDTLIEIKNNYGETIVEWMKPRSRSMGGIYPGQSAAKTSCDH